MAETKLKSRLIRHADLFIWDVDNTLYPYNDAVHEENHRAAAEAAMELAPGRWTLEEAITIARESYRKHGADFDDFVMDYGLPYEAMRRGQHDKLRAEAMITPDQDLIDLFKQIGARHVAITRSVGDWPDRAIAASLLTPYFSRRNSLAYDPILGPGRESYENKNEGPGSFEKMLEQTRTDASNAICIDDWHKNLEHAHALGIQTVWISYGKDKTIGKPDYVDLVFDTAAEFLRAYHEQYPEQVRQSTEDARFQDAETLRGIEEATDVLLSMPGGYPEASGLSEIARLGDTVFYSADEIREVLTQQLGWEVVNKVPGGGLRSADVHVNKVCDHDCPSCWVTFDGKHMSLDTFREVLKMAKESGLESLQFCGGEPTLTQDLITMAEIAKEQGFYITLRSHGRNMTKKAPIGEHNPDGDKTWAEEVARVFDEAVISIDGMDRENFEVRPFGAAKRSVDKITDDEARERAIGQAAEKQFAETIAGYKALSEAYGGNPAKKLEINTVVERANFRKIHKLGQYLNERVGSGDIRVDRWDITQVVPATNKTSEVHELHAISREEFWRSVLEASAVSERIAKRAKPVGPYPSCLIAEETGRVYVGGIEDVEIGSLKADGLPVLARRIKDFERRTQLEEQRAAPNSSGQLRYTPRER